MAASDKSSSSGGRPGGYNVSVKNTFLHVESQSDDSEIEGDPTGGLRRTYSAPSSVSNSSTSSRIQSQTAASHPDSTDRSGESSLLSLELMRVPVSDDGPGFSSFSDGCEPAEGHGGSSSSNAVNTLSARFLPQKDSDKETSAWPSPGSDPVLHEQGQCTPCSYHFSILRPCAYGAECKKCHLLHERTRRHRPSKSRREGCRRAISSILAEDAPELLSRIADKTPDVYTSRTQNSYACKLLLAKLRNQDNASSSTDKETGVAKPSTKTSL